MFKLNQIFKLNLLRIHKKPCQQRSEMDPVDTSIPGVRGELRSVRHLQLFGGRSQRFLVDLLLQESRGAQSTQQDQRQ